MIKNLLRIRASGNLRAKIAIDVIALNGTSFIPPFFPFKGLGSIVSIKQFKKKLSVPMGEFYKNCNSNALFITS